MKFTALLDKIDDKLNPIVVKELRQAVKSRMVVGILLIFLGLQVFLLGSTVLYRGWEEDFSMNWSAGNEVFRWQHGILLWAVGIFVPAYASIRLAAERSDHNVDLMFISTLRPASIVWGKFFAAVVLGLLIFSTCAPFMTFTYLLRGIDIPTILVMLGLNLLAMFFNVMAALFLAALPGSRIIKFIFCFVGFIGLCGLCGTLTGLSVEGITRGVEFEWLSEYWIGFATAIAGVVAFIGLFFCYTTVLISPPSSNRIFPLRIYVFIGWLVMTVAAFLAGAFNAGPMSLFPVGMYVVFSCPPLLVQLVISICERDHWGIRVSRTISKRWYLRLFAWLFYTGSAGGVTFSLLLLATTLALASAWTAFWDARGAVHDWEPMYNVLSVYFVVSLYTICYSLSAVLVRNYLLAEQIKVTFNWVIAALLLGLGCSVPFLFALIFFRDQLRYSNDMAWWFLSNPFWCVAEVAEGTRGWRRNSDFVNLVYWFSGIWSVVVLVLSIPWYFSQLKRFQPPRQREAERTAVNPLVLDAEVLESEPAAAGPSDIAITDAILRRTQTMQPPPPAPEETRSIIPEAR